ncbi:MAG: phosphatase PAP2 family protein [Eubacteriales bacterium]|jgi:membrane-associated phospholipid phosphatase
MLHSTKRQKYTMNILLGLFGLVNVWFFLIEGEIRVPSHYMYSRFDDLIPFVPAFIVPYYIWYLYQATPMIYFYFKSYESFCKLMMFSVLSFTIANIVYMIYPNGIFLRPSVLPDNLFGNWVAFTYLKDSPVNSAPSLHVLMSIATHVSIADYGSLRKRRWVVWSSFALMIIICMSTVFVKQHSIVDVIMGSGIGYLLYLLIYRRKSYSKSLATEYR